MLFALVMGFYSDFVVTDRPFVVTEFTTEVPKKPIEPKTGETVPVKETTFKPYVLMFTADYCPPCNNFKANEEQKVKDAGYDVVHVTGSGLIGVPSIPRFVIFTEDKKNKPLADLSIAKDTFKGFTKAEVLISALREADKPKVSTSNRYTSSELSSWISANYKVGDVFTRGYMAKGHENQVKVHLVNEHGFKPDQVNPLSTWEANCLHDAVHPQLDKDGKVISQPLITATKD